MNILKKINARVLKWAQNISLKGITYTFGTAKITAYDLRKQLGREFNGSLHGVNTTHYIIGFETVDGKPVFEPHDIPVGHIITDISCWHPKEIEVAAVAP